VPPNEMRQWLQESLSASTLSEASVEYLLGRGAKEETYTGLGVTTWGNVYTATPCEIFKSRYGERGEKLRGCLIIPFYSPSGRLVGFEGRSIHSKWITDYRIMPECKWLPVWIGTNLAVPKLWAGNGTVWVVEGVFDLFAMNWVVPETNSILASVRACLSAEHVNFLRRHAEYVNVVYDEDDAGISCSKIQYCGGKDPGVIWDLGGEEALRCSFNNLCF
jgi:hypothetical protein